MKIEFSNGCHFSLYLSVFILRPYYLRTHSCSSRATSGDVPSSHLYDFGMSFDIRRLFSTLREHHLHWEASTDVKSTGTLAMVRSPGFTFQVICYFYGTVTAHMHHLLLGQTACCFTLPGDFAGFVSEQIGLGYKVPRGKLPVTKWVSRWWSSNTGVLHADPSQIAVPLFVKPCDYRCF